jgi:type IV pilus assembly protein PilN
LAERRPELGLSPAAPPVRESRNLLLQGAAWGGGVLLLTLVGLGVMRWWETYQRQQLEALLPVEQTVLATEAKLRRLKLRTASLEKDNRQIAQQLVAVRSGSALLEQLRRITPQGVQLQDLSVNGDAISVSGVVQAGGRPGPLERINSLVLAMAALPASKDEGVKVVKITRTDKGDGSVVSFSLTWGLDLSVQPTLAEFEALGAKGMAERLRLLQLKGVAL